MRKIIVFMCLTVLVAFTSPGLKAAEAFSYQGKVTPISEAVDFSYKPFSATWEMISTMEQGGEEMQVRYKISGAAKALGEDKLSWTFMIKEMVIGGEIIQPDIPFDLFEIRIITSLKGKIIKLDTFFTDPKLNKDLQNHMKFREFVETAGDFAPRLAASAIASGDQFFTASGANLGDKGADGAVLAGWGEHDGKKVVVLDADRSFEFLDQQSGMKFDVVATGYSLLDAGTLMSLKTEVLTVLTDKATGEKMTIRMQARTY